MEYCFDVSFTKCKKTRVDLMTYAHVGEMSNKITNYIKSVQLRIELAHTAPAKTDENNNQLVDLSNGNMAAVD
uniref:Uncharacterized protein n=1 Tax=Romanomermis culicivorax TaxID=13658 RepID=A0A915KC68_ROMCU